MSIFLYNTINRRKEAFVPRSEGRVTMYVCGPTVYSAPHIGNARPAVVFDVLARLLRSRYELTYARNITDVDDKINAAASASGLDIRTLSGGIAGDDIDITWDISNTSSNAVSGNWKDAVYISADQNWDINDVLIGEETHTGGLGAGGVYTRRMKVLLEEYMKAINSIMPGLTPGPYYVIVRTDIINNINEEDEENNDGVSSTTMAIDVQELTLGVPDTSAVTNEEREHFRLSLPENHDLRVVVDCASQYDEAELYIRNGEVPTRVAYDHHFTVDAYRDVIVPGIAGDNMYLMVYGDYIVGNGNYTIQADSIFFGLIDCTPSTVDNTGFVTFSLLGGRLASAYSVYLENASYDTVTAWRIDAENSTSIKAHFDLSGVTPGLYDIHVATTEFGATELSPGVEIIPGAGAIIEPSIKGPSAIRSDGIGAYAISLVNIGVADAYDVISSITIDTNTEYQLVIDGATSFPQVSDGQPVMIHTSFIGVGERAHYELRLWGGETDLLIDAISTYYSPMLVAAETEDVVIADWVHETHDAFLDKLETYGVTIDSAQCYAYYMDDWTASTRSGTDRTETDFLDLKILQTTLAALSDLQDPLVPPQNTGITAQGITYSIIEAEDQYLKAKGSNKYKRKNHNVTVRVSRDPNEKVGYALPDGDNFVSQLFDIPYTVYFENLPEASASARIVQVLDTLDTDLDWRTFRLGNIAYGDTVLTVPENSTWFHRTIDMGASGLVLIIDAGINYTNGVVHWNFTTFDPVAGRPPDDPNAGFLPPNDSTGAGEGIVYFTSRAHPHAEDGAEITNRALIVFDENDPIITNDVVNILERVYSDIQIAAVSGYSIYPSYIEGEPVTINATVTNTGAEETGSFTVEFYEGDPGAGGTLIGFPQIVTSLDVGEEQSVEVSWLPLSTGAHPIHVIADYSGLVTEADEMNNVRVFTIDIESRMYTVYLEDDINLVALPLEPSVPYAASTFSASLGATMIIRYDTGNELFETYNADLGSGPDFTVENKLGYIAVLPVGGAKEFTYAGETHSDSLTLVEGLNFVSLPLMPDNPITMRDFCYAIDASALVYYNSALDSTIGFEAFIPGFHDGEGAEIRGAHGYLAVCELSAAVGFGGIGWLGSEDPPQYTGAPLMVAGGGRASKAPVLGVTGVVYETAWGDLKPISEEKDVSIINTRTGDRIGVTLDPNTGEFTGAFVDISNKKPAVPGDTLEIVVNDSDGRLLGPPTSYVLTEADIARRYANFDAVTTGLTPSITTLYQNFPNPFNPSTHVRYQLAQSGKVDLKVFNVAGQLVKIIVSDKQNAGYYQIAWRGDNNRGKQVASGVYFCRLETPGYTKSMKMIVVR